MTRMLHLFPSSAHSAHVLWVIIINMCVWMMWIANQQLALACTKLIMFHTLMPRVALRELPRICRLSMPNANARFATQMIAHIFYFCNCSDFHWHAMNSMLSSMVFRCNTNLRWFIVSPVYESAKQRVTKRNEINISINNSINHLLSFEWVWIESHSLSYHRIHFVLFDVCKIWVYEHILLACYSEWSAILNGVLYARSA